MRRAFLLIVLAVVLAACSSHSSPSFVAGRSHVDVDSPELVKLKKQTDVPDCPRSSGAGTSLPSMSLKCLGGGRPVDLAKLRGPLILNFWQARCGPCRQEMPALAAYAASQKVVRVIGVDFLDVEPEAALELAQKSKVGYPLVADPAGNLDRADPLPHVGALPFTVFVASDGQIAHVEAHPFESEADVAAAARKYLG